MDSGEGFGGVEVEFAVLKRDGVHLCGMDAQELAGTGIAGEGEKFGKILPWEDSGDADAICIGRSSEAGRLFVCEKLQLNQMEWGDGRLIAGEQDDGIRRRRVSERGAKAGVDGGGHALLPVRILHQFTPGYLQMLTEHICAGAEDDEYIVNTGFKSDANGAREQRFMVNGDQLLGLAEAGGGPGSKDDSGGVHHFPFEGSIAAAKGESMEQTSSGEEVRTALSRCCHISAAVMRRGRAL